MRTVRFLLLAVTASLALVGCGADDGDRTAQLQEYLRQAHEFDREYIDIHEVTYADGNVVLEAEMPPIPLPRAAVYCEWVSDWLYEEGRGTADSDVMIRGNGQDLLTRRGLSESCVEAMSIARD